MSLDLSWWLAAIEIPVLGALFAYVLRQQQSLEDNIERLRGDLSRAKLSIAQTYASRAGVREVEDRLTSHLLRIERKLDATALQTAALKGKGGVK